MNYEIGNHRLSCFDKKNLLKKEVKIKKKLDSTVSGFVFYEVHGEMFFLRKEGVLYINDCC